MDVVDSVEVMGGQCRRVPVTWRLASDIGLTQCRPIGGWLLATRCRRSLVTEAEVHLNRNTETTLVEELTYLRHIQ